MWIMKQRGIRELIHYLDDYLFFGDPDSQECAEALSLAFNYAGAWVYPSQLTSSKGLQTP